VASRGISVGVRDLGWGFWQYACFPLTNPTLPVTGNGDVEASEIIEKLAGPRYID